MIQLSILFVWQFDQKVLVDAAVHSERVQVIRCNIKPGSDERSIGLACIKYMHLIDTHQ
jgi:hypothetical protein